ncbi:MAG TPA: mandelate racemase/muconate lactonizing enzyme family protein [Cyclobacteriaceae bacterium]|nr:mandelate racemase/muconate lactonizing enzyme family protein [Cyclobacteriaceae bacterium]HRJ83855.1 mandelate racemase/muconate lactonizing enzyme family protein [Cyclobacteriaceae bacterium]
MTSRRTFLKQSLYATSAISFGLPMLSSFSGPPRSASLKNEGYPIVIKSIELLRWNDHHFVVVMSADGVTGITLANTRIDFLYGVFNGLVKPYFLGQDARTLPVLIDGVYKDERNYKFSGMPFWNCVGHIEVAIWDLIGKTDNRPVYQLLGNQLRTEVPMYLSSLTRDNPAEEEVERIKERLVITGCTAVKIKVGGRLRTNKFADERSKKIVSLLRKYSDSLTIYADANGSYDVKQGIDMGKFLEDHHVAIYEEPCVWEDFESNKKVADALKKIKVAGGEQDTSYYRFEWYCRNNGLDIVQPDIYYNGGILRTLAIAQLAHLYKKGFAPHTPKADPLEAPFLHLAAVAPSLYGFQEFPLSGVGKKQPDWYAPHFEVKEGKLPILSTIGLGVEYDPAILKKATKIE